MKIAIIIAAIIVCILHLVASLVWKIIAIACIEYQHDNGISSDNIAEYIPRAIRMALLLFIL
ncbi:hypothetical protein [Ruminococcus sp.]